MTRADATAGAGGGREGACCGVLGSTFHAAVTRETTDNAKSKKCDVFGTTHVIHTQAKPGTEIFFDVI